MMKTAAMYGLFGFTVTAVFVGAWLLVVMILGLLARILGGGESDEEE